MTAPDFDALAREWLESNLVKNSGQRMAVLANMLRSVHASRDAEVSAAREQGIREAAEVCRPGGVWPDPIGRSLMESILALLSAPKGG